MKVSLDWLSEFIEISRNADALAKDITEHCFEVEEVIPVGTAQYRFSNVKIARVLNFDKHPNADRLRVVSLDLGGETVEPVVCGANNFVAGDIVALALPGAVIPQNIHSEQHEEFVLGKAAIRGVESQGMICSAFELGLAPQPEDKPEILILKKDSPLGMDLGEYLASTGKIRDKVLNLSLPANRPDLFSHLGIARESAAILNLKKKPQLAEIQEAKKISVPGTLSVDIKNKDACRYYKGMRIKVQVGPSPEIIRDRLAALGLRSINNVVDITNYVMYELGEPLHAFDSRFVTGGIMVRNAKQGEEILTIDHKTRVLDQNMLVIADKEKALAVAGIMGGLQSEVSESTTEIILEAANFEPTQIRRTSKKLGLRTDGSGFWEKGLHPIQAELGAQRALELLQKYAQAELVEQKTVGDAKAETRTIKFTVEQINGLLGSDFSVSEAAKHLKQLGFAYSGEQSMTVEVPYYRADMSNYADIADEFLKIAGLNIIEKQPLQINRQDSEVNADMPLNELKEQMAGFGFNEVQTYSFISEKDILAFGQKGPEEHVKVKNPLSADQGYLRRHLLISLLKNAALNARNFEAFKIFELGKGYQGYLKEDNLLTYINYDKSKTSEELFAEAKGVLEMLISKHTGSQIEYKQRNENIVDFSILGKQIGSIGIVQRSILDSFDVPAAVAYCKMKIDVLLAVKEQKKVFGFSRYPRRVLDVSLVVSTDLEWEKIDGIVRKHGGDILTAIELFEADYLYPKDKLPKFHKELAQKGLKNLAFHMLFQAPDRTLEDSEILPIYDKIVGELKSKLNAEIR